MIQVCLHILYRFKKSITVIIYCQSYSHGVAMDSYLDILPKGSTAVAVKTKGHNLFIDNEGISSTGCWVVSNDRIDDYVIIFHQTSSANNVYIGEFVGKNAEEYSERQGKNTLDIESSLKI